MEVPDEVGSVIHFLAVDYNVNLEQVANLVSRQVYDIVSILNDNL